MYYSHGNGGVLYLKAARAPDSKLSGRSLEQLQVHSVLYTPMKGNKGMLPLGTRGGDSIKNPVQNFV